MLITGTGCGKKEVIDQQPISTPVQAATSAGETAQAPASKPGGETTQPSMVRADNEPATQTASAISTSPSTQDTKLAETSPEKTGAPAPDSAPKQNQTTSEPEPPAAKEEEKPTTSQKSPFEEYLAGLPGRFVPENAAGVTALYQFNITDGHPGKYFVKIENGWCTVGKGKVSNPNITINVGEQLWVDIAHDKVNGTMAYLTGKFTANGNTDYLSNMKKYFKKLE